MPPTHQRYRHIPARALIEPHDALVHLGDDIGGQEAQYKRRIGRWLLWRSGPATGADARYLAVDADDLTRTFAFRLFPDGEGSGEGPDRVRYERFRTWKEALRDSG